jgi:hypothetical protein
METVEKKRNKTIVITIPDSVVHQTGTLFARGEVRSSGRGREKKKNESRQGGDGEVDSGRTPVASAAASSSGYFPAKVVPISLSLVAPHHVLSCGSINTYPSICIYIYIYIYI